MAGIQLTGADEYVSPSSMSGAMQTATVEEINVPVFIDEYLQQSAHTSATTATTTSINYSPISSSSNCNISGGISLSRGSASNNNTNIENGNGIGILQELCLDDDQTVIDFDMEMFGDNCDVMSICNSNSNNFNNNNNNIIYNTPNNYNNISNDCLELCEEMGRDEEQLSQQYHILPDVDIFDQLLLSQGLSNEEDCLDLVNAYDINSDFTDEDKKSVMMGSQNPLISGGSQFLTQFINSEPIIPKLEDMEMEENTLYAIETAPVSAQSSPQPPIITTVTQPTRMEEKRRKMHLILPSENVEDQLKTPVMIANVMALEGTMGDALFTTQMHPKSVDCIVQNLIDETSNLENISIDDSPSTPQSFVSSSFATHTSFTEYTAPNSPALSTNSNQQRRKRGRPCKEHSDQPDPNQLENLSELERKKALDRWKNNEASRVSRRKNKEKEEKEIEKFETLLARNKILLKEKSELSKIEAKLKRALLRGVKV